MNRADLCFLIEASFTARRPDYVRAICNSWLAASPGDVGMRFYLARSLATEKRTQEAVAALDTVTTIDLEHLAAYRLVTTIGLPGVEVARAAAVIHVLTGQPLPAGTQAPAWMKPARNAVVALGAGYFATAREQIDAALREEPSLPLLSLILVKTHWQAGEIELALPLAKGFHERWPQGVAFLLCLAEGLLRNGSEHEAVELLHAASALDANGDVVSRYWGQSHPYRDLWPQPPNVALPGPIPAEVIALLGMNRIERRRMTAADEPPRRENTLSTADLPQAGSMPAKSVSHAKVPSAAQAKTRLKADLKSELPQTTAEVEGDNAPEPASSEPLPEITGPQTTVPSSAPEELRDIQSALNSIAAQINAGRYQRKPVHVILFSPKLLQAKFGPEGAEQVLKLIGELATVSAKRRNVMVVLLAPDSPSAEFDLKPVDPRNAWEVKMILHDLDRRLMAKGRAIGSLLIVGGDDLLPFHQLPNPCDDVDDGIPSDNPYGTSDDNYFIPEWPVGRLPSPCGRDPEPLCRLLRHTIAAHASTGLSAEWWRGFIFRLFQRWIKEKPPSSIGYAASIWREASLDVFAPIGAAKDLHTSPPLDAESAPSISKMNLAYFNLHGVEDGPNWFGQRTEDDGYGLLYPVAFQPKDAGKDALPKVVFTEACYGANILNKAEPDAAMCLRLLADGACAFVGSTKIAYGSVAPPLIGADLVGRLLWDQIMGGAPVGEALRRAKLYLAHAMNQRQHFLDGEDQKTLISFVLYGDPLLPVRNRASQSAPGRRSKELPALKTVVMEYERAEETEIQTEMVSEIKALLSRYLPGSESAQVSLQRPLSPVGAKSKAAPTHRVYTFAKTIRSNSLALPTFARVTVNKQGRVVKIAVSR